MLDRSQKLNALVVGASQGIGLGFVRHLLKDECVGQVFATYRNESTSGELLSLGEQASGRLTNLPLDVTDESTIEAAFKQLENSVDKLDLVIYCVGVLHEGAVQPEKSLRDIESEHLLYAFQVNSVGAVLVAKHLVGLLDRKTPSIFASISAKVGSIADNHLGGWYGYRASKAALNMFVRTISIEYTRRCPSTCVVAIHPGTTATRLSEPFQSNVPEDQLSTVEETVELISGVLAKLKLEDSGKFFSWNGSELPW